MGKQKTFKDLMEERYGEEYDKVFITNENITPIQTGSFSLDVCIGIGGVPRRRITLIEGAEGSGKSTLALSICRNAIKSGEKALYVDVENQMDFDYIEQLLGESIDQERLVLAKPKDSDQAFKICEAAIDSNEFGVIILDSVAALSPPEEQKKEFEDANMAIIPRDLAKFLRRNAYKIRDNNIAFIFINQVRDLIGSYVKAFSSPGGHALKHYSSVTVFLSKGKEITAGEDSIGILTKFVVKKNKLSAPFRTFTIPIIFGKGVDTIRDLISYAEVLGVIRRAGPYYKFEEVTLGKGMLDAMEFLENDKETLDKISQMCYNLVGKLKQGVPEILEDE